MQNQKRLDLILSAKYPSFSRAFLQKFIRTYGVSIHGKFIKKLHLLITEDTVISLDDEELHNFIEEQKSHKEGSFILEKHRILYDGKSFFVIDKPPGICTGIITGNFFPVHRLDKDTSGILVIAKNPVTQAALQTQWKSRSVKKTYIALVARKLEPRKGAIEAPIFRSSRDRKKMAVSSAKKARSAYTEYQVIDYFFSTFYIPSALQRDPALAGYSTFSLVKLFPTTGRTHQIRVHLASIGHPVIGDILYGDKKLNKKFEQEYGLRRQFLHAAELTLKDPKTKKKITFTSKLPEDLEAVILRFSKDDGHGLTLQLRSGQASSP